MCSGLGCDLKPAGRSPATLAGGFNCMGSNGELIATYGDTTVDAIATKYRTLLERRQPAS